MGSAARVTSAAEGLPRRRFTVAEVEAMVAAGVMDEDERRADRGELVPTSPKGIRHDSVKTARCAAGIAWRRTTSSCSAERRHLSRTRRRHLSARNRHSRSRRRQSSARRGDRGFVTALRQGRKAAPYASFGVRELRAIDAVGLTTRVIREPSGDGFRDARDLTASDPLVPPIAPDAFGLRLDELDLA
jgi:hypothetical protein